MNIVRGVADYLRKAPPPPPPPAPGGDAAPTTSFPAGDFDDAPTPRVVFSGSLEEGALNVLWKNYENALDKADKEKSLQIFVLRFVETFRDWGPHPTEQLVDQELGNNETVVGCSCGHPSEVILILIQEISLITSTFTEISSDGNVVATGSYDTTVMIWHAFRGRPIDKKMRGANFELSEKEHVIVESPVHILCGHDDIITCLFVSTELDIVISGSKDGTCIFHALREGRYVRSIQHPSGVGLSKLVASQHGRVVLYSENDISLHMYSINGRHIASSATLGRLNCIELSCCGDFIVCAGELGQIVLRSMHSLGIVWRYDGNGKTITSLAVTPEECILAGTKNGSLLVFSIEAPLLRRGSMQRNRIKPSTTG